MKGKSANTRRTSSRAIKELPELTDEMLSRAVLKRGGKRVGRPKTENPKVAISLRLPPEVLSAGGQRVRVGRPEWPMSSPRGRRNCRLTTACSRRPGQSSNLPTQICRLSGARLILAVRRHRRGFVVS